MISLPAFAQQLVDTVEVGSAPRAVIMNPVTNKIYVANWAGQSVTEIDGATDQTKTVHVPQIDVRALAVNSVTNKIYVTDDASQSLTVIDGATLSTTSVTVGGNASAVAVNPVTNKIFVPSPFGNVTIIDGATLVTTTLTIPGSPTTVAVNPVTNKIYVGDSITNRVTVIDGVTLATKTVTVANGGSYALVVNSVTNKIYVVQNPLQGQTVTVIEGESLATTSVTVGQYPVDVAINAVTNKIYVACEIGTVTVIDGATNETTDVAAGKEPFAVAVNPVANEIYAVNGQSNNVTVIDGRDLSTITVGVGNDPDAVAINPATNRTYVANFGDDTVSVIAAPTALQFIAVTPCRLMDTRTNSDPIQGNTSRDFTVPQLGGCNIPTTAAAYSLNVTVVPPGPLGYLTIWPTGGSQPNVSTLNSYDGRVKANAAIVPAGSQGAVSVYVSDTTDLVLDIDGYFAPVSNSTLAFYPLSPCRIADTRNSPGDLGGPYLTGGVPRDFPVQEASSCNVPNTAEAYSLNFTAVPHGPLGFLTVWPTGQSQPGVSTLNSYTGQLVANAAIVPAGTDGKVSTFASNDTDLVIDINGYFAAAGQGGLSLYPVAPCRVLDTRTVGNGQPFSGELTVDVLNSACAPSSTAQAYVFNATVVPYGPLGFLTLWPDGSDQPGVSTLNAADGAVTSNMAIVPAGSQGKIDAYATDLTQLILDISSYFAP